MNDEFEMWWANEPWAPAPRCDEDYKMRAHTWAFLAWQASRASKPSLRASQLETLENFERLAKAGIDVSKDVIAFTRFAFGETK